MIHVIVSVGSGDRKAAVISDPLITDVASANIRAAQELANSTYIIMSRSITFPHEPDGGHAVLTTELSHQPLRILGRHVVTGRSINLSNGVATDTVALEQYRRMIL